MLHNFKFFIITLSLLISNLDCIAQNKVLGAMNDDYSFTLGSKTLSPAENAKQFSAIKKELDNSFYQGWYYAVVQFYEQPQIASSSEMNTQIPSLVCVNKLTCISAISSNVKTKTLKKYGVRAVLSLTPELKIQGGLYAHKTADEKISVNIVVPANIRLDEIKQQLAEKGAATSLEFLADSVRKYVAKATKSEAEAIAALPYVLQIEAGGMR